MDCFTGTPIIQDRACWTLHIVKHLVGPMSCGIRVQGDNCQSGWHFRRDGTTWEDGTFSAVLGISRSVAAKYGEGDIITVAFDGVRGTLSLWKR